MESHHRCRKTGNDWRVAGTGEASQAECDWLAAGCGRAASLRAWACGLRIGSVFDSFF
jgi:hypothetical protein